MNNDSLTRIISSSDSSGSRTTSSIPTDCESIVPCSEGDTVSSTNRSSSSTTTSTSSRCEAFQTKVLHRLCHQYPPQQTLSPASIDDNLKQPKPKRLTSTMVSPFANNNATTCSNANSNLWRSPSPSKRPYTSAFVPFSPTQQSCGDHVVNVISYDSCIELIETLSLGAPKAEEDEELSSAEDEDREVKELNKSEMKRRSRRKILLEEEDGTASSSAVSTSSASTAFYWMLSSAAPSTKLREGANVSVDRWWMSAATPNQLYCSTTASLHGDE